MNDKTIINKIVLGKVTKIGKTFFEVITSDRTKGVVFVNEVSDYYVNDLNNVVNVGDVLYLVVKKIENDRLILSFKENRSDFLRTPFEYSLIDSKNEDFKNVLEFTKKEIKKWKELE